MAGVLAAAGAVETEVGSDAPLRLSRTRSCAGGSPDLPCDIALRRAIEASRPEEKVVVLPVLISFSRFVRI